MLHKAALPLTIAALALVASVGFAAASTETAPETTPEATPAAVATPALTKEKCLKAIEEDNKLNEPKLTEAFLKQCAELTTAAAPLRSATLDENSTEANTDEGPTRRPRTLEEMRRAMDEEIAEELALRRTTRDSQIAAQMGELQRRINDPNQNAAALRESDLLRRSLGGAATVAHYHELFEIDQIINREGAKVQYQAEANAAEAYAALSQRPPEELTTDDKINLASTASMAGAYAGRGARESGTTNELTQAMIDRDPVFAKAFNQAKAEEPVNEGVGAVFGQFPEAEPAVVAGLARTGQCNSPLGEIPSMPCGVINSPFGARPHILESPYHVGFDIRANRGDPIFGTAIGTIEEIRPEGRGTGRVAVILRHGNTGFVTVFRHVQAGSTLAEGTRVDGNTQIGRVETAGSGPHKHIEFWLNGRVLNVNNYNQLAYAHLCTIGCPTQANTQQATVLAPTRVITQPVTDRTLDFGEGSSANIALRGTPVGEPDPNATAGFRLGSHQLARAGQVGGAGTLTLSPNLDTNNIGDGGWADTAPRFGPNVGAYNGSPQPNNGQPLQPNQNIQQALSGLGKNSPNAITLASLDERRDGKATQKLTAEACRQQLKETRFAMDVLLKNPECAGVR